MKIPSLNTRLFVAISLGMLLVGCSMAPTYERPSSPVADRIGNTSAAVASTQQFQHSWNSFVRSEQLRSLVETALENNRDLRVSMLNVDVARATYRIQNAERFPSLSATADNTRQRTPANLNGTSNSQITQSATAGVRLSSFEVDLFGRLASLSNAAQEEYFAVQSNADAARLILVSEVINTYIQYNSKLQQKDFAAQTLSAREQAFELTLIRQKNGIAHELEFQDAKGLAENARAENARLTRELEQARNALQILAGVSSISEFLPATADRTDIVNESFLSAVSSEVLLARPDVIAAEHQLKARNADIGAARAAFFPSITLTGLYGSSSTEFSNLFKSGQESWSFTPQVSLPIFSAGKLRANVDVANLRKDIAVANYEASIQTAFGDVANAITAISTNAIEADALKKQAESALETQRLTELRYQSGVDDQLRYLDAQRSAWSALVSAVEAHANKATAQVALLKALGGNWVNDPQIVGHD